jgi:hypothetical protein
MIAQHFLVRQFFLELGHTAPSVNNPFIDLRPMNPGPATTGMGVPEERRSPTGHTVSGHVNGPAGKKGVEREMGGNTAPFIKFRKGFI